MKIFEEPVLEIVKFDMIDVIATSGGPDNWETPDL